MIPARLIRTVPARTDPETEAWWAASCELHPDWEHVTWRDPLNPAEFPLTSPHWRRCRKGAQLAGLVRLEALWRHGGVYLDSDYELWRSLEPLRGATIVVGHEDPGVIPDAFIAAEAGHPLIREAIDLAIDRIPGGPWASGPGVTTTLFAAHPDVLVLPPQALYPYHYSVKADVDVGRVRAENPWAFGAHHWRASWL